MQIIFWNNKQCEIKHKFFRKLSLGKNSWACSQKWLCLENTRWYSWIHVSGDDYSVINVSNFSYPNNFHLRESPSNLSTFLQMGNLLGFLNNQSLKIKKKIMKYPLSPQHPPPKKLSISLWVWEWFGWKIPLTIYSLKLLSTEKWILNRKKFGHQLFIQ